MAKATLKDEIKKVKPFENLEQEVYLNLMRTADLLSGEFAELFRSFGLSDPQYNVLRILRGAGKEGLPCLEIGARMITRLPDITRLVDRLETAGYVTRKRDEADRRVVMVTITTAGLALLKKLDDPTITLHVDILKNLNTKELSTLNKLLAKIRLTE